jgi:hypothetical protein
VAGVARRPPCDFEGDLPRLVRRVSLLASGRERFGYDAETIHAITARIPLAGPPTRRGGKSRELRNAVLAGLESYSTVIALVDARTDEVSGMRRDIEEILRQCRERSSDVLVAIGLAVQEVEIWMLADPEARKAAFGEAAAGHAMPTDLEGVRDPKKLWKDRTGQATRPEEIDAELFADQQRAAAWVALRPEVVAQACPQGFAPFHDAVVRALPWTRR